MRRYILVSGLPGSGKSTIGAQLAARLQLPLFDKDTILEAMFDGLGVGDAAWRTILSRSADLVLEKLCRDSPCAVIVSWWRHPAAGLESGTPVNWISELANQLVEVHCRCPAELAVERFFNRKRHHGHLDNLKSISDEMNKFYALASLGPLEIGTVIEVDTRTNVEVEELVARIERHWANPSLDTVAMGVSA